MRVLRIEDANGLGPYHSTTVLCNPYPECQPGPFDDGFERIYNNFKFGFLTDDQLLNWFDPSVERCKDYWEILSDCNYNIVEFEVDDCYVVKGKNQIQFDRDEARIINIIPVSQLWS